MRNTILIIVLSLLFFGCNKDTSNSSPQLTYKSENTTVLQKGQLIYFTLSFTDVNGNLDSLFVQDVSRTCSGFKDSSALPGFPSIKNQKGDIIVTYGDSTLPYLSSIDVCGSNGVFNNDTCYFRFAVKDASGKTSDTVQSPQIVIINQ